MYFQKRIQLATFLSFLFILWSNSTYSPIGKRAGFYCNDTTIQKPYTGDSISASLLFATLLIGGALVVYLSEYIFRSVSVQTNTSDCSQYLKCFYAGFAHVLAFTELLKFTCAELRPHFLHTCQPDFSNIKCTEGLVTIFNCTGSAPKWMIERDIYKSFPSGHASLTFYAFVFITKYIFFKSANVPSSGIVSLWNKFIPTILLVWSLTCCISRIYDHRHFWWDILFGAIIGLFGGLLTANFSLKSDINAYKKK